MPERPAYRMARRKRPDAPAQRSSRGAADERDGFRPDIEGLRAVAVLLVMAYHARVPGWTGGYVGVDVFFVISGFLITGVITRELHSTGQLSLRRFYARRIRRLLPAALVVIAATVLASAILLPPLRVPDVAADGAAAALYVSNLRFAMQATDYLQSELDPSPLLHFWSLGVEEQFYLFWPAMLLLAAGRRADLGRIARLVAVVTVASLVLSVTLTQTDAPLAFFILPTRAWELGIGALLVPLGAQVVRLPRMVLGSAAALGLITIVAGARVFDVTTPFPGTAALVPVAGAALVLAGGLAGPLTWPSRILATPPFRWVGRISYSLYLWHWPLLVLPAAAMGAPLPAVATIGLVGLTFVLAAASQRWIEDPIRHGRLAAWPPNRTLALAGAMSVVIAAGSIGLGRVTMPSVAASDAAVPTDVVLPNSSGPPSSGGSARISPSPSLAPPSVAPTPTDPLIAATLPPTPAGPVPPDLVPPLAEVRDDNPPVYADGCHGDTLAVVPPPCAYGHPDSRSSVFLIGDSHAAQWFPALERLARDRDWRLVSLTKSACPAADLEVWNILLKRPYRECATWWSAVLKRIAAEHPVLVVAANSGGATLAVDGAPVPPGDREDLWTAGVERFLASVGKKADAVVLIGDTPNPAGDPPVCLSDHLDDMLACATPSSLAIDAVHMASDRTAAAGSGATFIDPSPWVCPTEPCPATIGRFVVYRDGHHITATFARALTRYLDAALPELPHR